MISGIYKITNPFGQAYIGQSMDVDRRFEQHRKCLSSNRHLNMSMKKHGIENHIFEILEECDIYSLRDRERCFLKYYKKKIILFNYSITYFTKEDFNVINEKIFLENVVHQKRETKRIKKESIQNGTTGVTVRIVRKVADLVTRERCKEIAENAVNKEYKKLIKNK